MWSVRNYIQLQGTAALIWTMRKTYTGINRGKNSRKPSGGMLTSQYADLKGFTVRTLVDSLGDIKRLLILNHKISYSDLVLNLNMSLIKWAEKLVKFKS